MQYRKSDNTIVLHVDELAAYARETEHPSIVSEKYGFTSIPLSAVTDITETPPPCADTGTEIAGLFPLDDFSVELHGHTDSIAFDGEIHTVEEIISVPTLRQDLMPLSYPVRFAQAVCYATMVCRTGNIDKAAIQITYRRCSDGAKKSFRTVLAYPLLERIVIALLLRATPFLKLAVERDTFRLQELQTLPFPYPSVRQGQKDFIHEAFSAIRKGERLFVSAPCGIGKTMSSLYPALRAIGMGKAHRIFYCTAKSITGNAALDGARKLSQYAPHMRCIQLLAKEQMCCTDSFLPMKCSVCPALRAVGEKRTYRSYVQRQEEAILEVLRADTIYTPQLLRACAIRHQVCPHELALDISEFCDLIICDYNYVFNDSMRLRRYFKNRKRQEKYIFLIDEAHNLPDRARAMYSGTLSLSDIRELRRIKDTSFANDDAFDEALLEVEKWFLAIGRLCEKDAVLTIEDNKEYHVGYYKDKQIPGTLEKRLENLIGILRKRIRDGVLCTEELYAHRQTLQAFAAVLPYMDDRFCFFAEKKQPVGDTGEESTLTVQVLCLDPGGVLANMLASSHASIFFSATLAPAEYYQSITGSMDSVYLDLPSPYEQENLCLIAYDGISTRYSDRRETAEDTADIIARTAAAKEGNYIVYFPSYQYMRSVYKAFCSIMPDVQTIVQKRSMSYRDREIFLSAFEKEHNRTLVGFCVLGGIFSEGIDLIGNALIGAMIVGTGLPGLSPELNLIAEYYQNLSENGKEFAYIYPGMNKVLQAAGRVIRSETDKGVVLLIDDRYNEPGMKLLLPAHWDHLRYTADPASLSKMLKKFWHT